MAKDTVVTLIIPQEKFNYLKIVLNNHRDFIYKLGIPEVIKDSLVKDTSIIRTIIDTGRKGA